MHNLDELIITLTLDDDVEVECAVLAILEVKSQEYIALIPLEEEDEAEDESTIFIYRFKEVNGEPELSNIESDEEYDLVEEAFDEWLDAQDFEEIDEEE